MYAEKRTYGKRKFAFLGRQMINGKRRFLFQQTWPSMYRTGIREERITRRNMHPASRRMLILILIIIII
jgi:hypothetical protein